MFPWRSHWGRPCFVAPPVDLMRDDLVPLDVLWGRSAGACKVLEALTRTALSVMEDVLRRQMTGVPGPDPAVIAAAARCPGEFRWVRYPVISGCCRGPCAGGSPRRWG